MGNPQKQNHLYVAPQHLPQQNLAQPGYTYPPPPSPTKTQYPQATYKAGFLQKQSNVGLQQQTMPAMAPQQTFAGGYRPSQMQHPRPNAPQLAPQLAPWTTGLFDCSQDPTNALTTACFPCVTFGQIAEILNKGHTSCATSAIMYAAVPCSMSRGYRTRLRRQFGLMEAPAPDWMIHFFCQWCALCQEYRELDNRGLNPSLGWHAIVNKNMQMQQSPTAPPNKQTMNYNSTGNT